MTEQEQIFTGFNAEMERQARDGSEYIFGATSPLCLTTKLKNPLHTYYPTGEVQRASDSDMMDCTDRAPINIYETKFNGLCAERIFSDEDIKWLHDKGYFDSAGKIAFSDILIDIKAGTTKNGNSVKSAVDTIRKVGLIPKKMLPLYSSQTWDWNMNPARITAEMLALGQEFLLRFPIYYDTVYPKDFKSIPTEMVDTAGYAWPIPINGIYPKVAGAFNHCFAVCLYVLYEAFDNYINPVNNGWTKRLASDYNLMDYAYRIIVTEAKKKDDIIINPIDNMKITLFHPAIQPHPAYKPEDCYFFSKHDNLYHFIDGNSVTAIGGENFVFQEVATIDFSKVGFPIGDINNEKNIVYVGILAALASFFKSFVKGKK